MCSCTLPCCSVLFPQRHTHTHTTRPLWPFPLTVFSSDHAKCSVRITSHTLIWICAPAPQPPSYWSAVPVEPLACSGCSEEWLRLTGSYRGGGAGPCVSPLYSQPQSPQLTRIALLFLILVSFRVCGPCWSGISSPRLPPTLSPFTDWTREQVPLPDLCAAHLLWWRLLKNSSLFNFFFLSGLSDRNVEYKAGGSVYLLSGLFMWIFCDKQILL